MEEKEYIETHFSYKDEYGEITELRRTHATETQDENDTYFLMCEFKRFLLACGYHQKWLDKIQYLEDNEEIVKKINL